jgi:hypothetical protein
LPVPLELNESSPFTVRYSALADAANASMQTTAETWRMRHLTSHFSGRASSLPARRRRTTTGAPSACARLKHDGPLQRVVMRDQSHSPSCSAGDPLQCAPTARTKRANSDASAGRWLGRRSCPP